MRRLLLPLAAFALISAASARAELIYGGQVDGARVSAGGEWDAGYVLGSEVHLFRRSGTPREAQVAFPGSVELDGLAGPYVLGRARDGRWLALWDGRRLRTFKRDSKQALFGPAGLALDRNGRAVVAYALWFPSRRTFLRLARLRSDGSLSIRGVTKEGFPPTPTLAAAAPVVLPSGEIRVVETFTPGAIAWRLTGWGKVLFSSALGIPTGGIAAAADATTLYAAWTTAFPTLGPPAVVLARHADRVRSGVAIENAVLAGMALTPQGVELAANRCIPGAAFGLEGDGVCGGLVGDAGLDGIVAGYGFDGMQRRLLLQTDAGLEWFAATAPLTTRVTLNRDLTGRVEGATGGVVRLYRERPGERLPLGELPLAADGTFAGADPTATPVTAAYRAVYADPATGLPYAALIGP